MSKIPIGEVVKKLRESQGLSQQALADKVSKLQGSLVSGGNISRLETGKQGYSEERLENIAEALGTCLTEIFSLAEGLDEFTELTRKISTLNQENRQKVEQIVLLYVDMESKEPPNQEDD